MRKLILKNSLSPGDIVMLTAAVRDLHRCYPGRFLTDVRTTCAALWEHNPYLTALDENDPAVEVIHCHYPLIKFSNQVPYHSLFGFIEFLNARLNLQIQPTAFQGDIHLSAEEKSWFSQVQELTGENTPFWIVVAGGKYDATVKWWATDRYQAVIDHYRRRIVFVQVGDWGHHHPKLEGVIDMRGRTDLRQLVRLVYHSQGILCPVTALMHLAAAVETKPGGAPRRPCVVVAGGREPVHWEAYPHHQFIHTVGALSCCRTGGCWRSRTVPLGDRDPRDKPKELCLHVIDGLPRCMAMISPAEVISRIEWYYQGGVLGHLTPSQSAAAAHAVALTRHNPYDEATLNFHNARIEADHFIQGMADYRGKHERRGIVICGTRMKSYANPWNCIHRLRQLGCSLPIQLWHLGPPDGDTQATARSLALKVQRVDALKVRRKHPARILSGQELKPYAIIHSPFREVLLLEADVVPMVNPEYLFEAAEYRQTGAVFWPDRSFTQPRHPIWQLSGVLCRSERAFESGLILVDQHQCWAALRLCLWYNQHSDLFCQRLRSYMPTFQAAFRKLDQAYTMPPHPPVRSRDTWCQHDFQGHRILHYGLRNKGS